jgi:hypothetical protein
VFKGRGSDDGVHNRHRHAPLFCARGQMPPTLGDGFGHRENPVGVPGTHIDLDPDLQRVPLLLISAK